MYIYFKYSSAHCRVDLLGVNLQTKIDLNHSLRCLQGYLAHKKTPTPVGPPWAHRHRPAVGS